MIELPRITNDISLGNILTLIGVIAVSCKSLGILRSEARKFIVDLHEGLLLAEERKINEGKPSTLKRIILSVVGLSAAGE